MCITINDDNILLGFQTYTTKNKVIIAQWIENIQPP